MLNHSFHRSTFLMKCIFAWSLLIWLGCNSPSQNTIVEVYECDMEMVENDLFFSYGHQFFNGATQFNGQARNGSFSCKLDSLHPYGVGIEIDSVSAGDHIIADICRSTTNPDAGLVFSIGKNFYFLMNRGVNINDPNWELVHADFILMGPYHNEKIKIYAFNPNQQEVYFDDLKIQIIPSEYEYERTVSGLPEYHLDIQPKDFDQIKQLRLNAFEKGFITPAEKKWFSARLNNEEVKIKIKGDWTDHLRGDKWSFKVKSKNEKFALMRPEARGFHREYLFHLLAKEEGLLVTEYDFVNVHLNGMNKGIYAKESAYDSSFFQYNQLNDGCVLKINEDQMWLYREEAPPENMYVKENELPLALICEIDSYQKNEWVDHAIEIFDNGRHNVQPLGDCFNLNEFAKYYALASIFRGEHGLIWHNTRVYYNPKTKLLSPVVYDAYGGYSRPPFSIYGINPEENNKPISSILMKNADFRKLYQQYLNHYGSTSFIQNYIDANQTLAKDLQNTFQQEYPDHYILFRILKQSKKDFDQTNIDSLLSVWDTVPVTIYSKDRIERFKGVQFSTDHLKIQKIHGEYRLYNYFHEPVRLVFQSDTISLNAWNFEGVPAYLSFKEKIKRSDFTPIQ